MRTTKTTFTVAIPADLKKRMDALPHINWPEYLKERLEVRMAELRKFEELRNSGTLAKMMLTDARRKR
ncbi:MAG: hypothetical protein ABIJ21_09300 [Nanoarchaeota archaeon]